MPALAGAASSRPALQPPLRPAARPVASSPWRKATGTAQTRRRFALVPRSMLTFPSPGSAEDQQGQRQQGQQPERRQAESPVPAARAPPASSQFAEAALAAARELKAAAVAAAAASRSPVLVAFRVPSCRLAFGEHLRLVGSCPQLGSWDVAKAPALQWAAGDDWTASVALPPGEHAFKLVLMRQGGGPGWEDGPDRTLKVPSLPGAIAAEASAAGEPMLHVTCSAFGDTAATRLRADRGRLQAAARAAQARISQLLQHKQELATRLAALEAEVEHSEVRVAGMREDTRRLVRAELQRLQQRGIVQAAVARLEGSTAQAQHAEAAQQTQQRGQRLKHPAAKRRKQKRAAARAQLHSRYAAHAEHAAPAEAMSAELAHEVKLAAAEAAIRAALQPAAVPAEEQALLQASLLGYRHEAPAEPDLPAEPVLPAEPERPAAQAGWVLEQAAAAEAEAMAVDEPLGHWQELEAAQLASEPTEEEAGTPRAAAAQTAAAQAVAAEAAAAAVLASPQVQPAAVAAMPAEAMVAEPFAAPRRLSAGSMAAEGGLLRASTARDGSICYSFAASPIQGSSSSASSSSSRGQTQLSAYLLAERYLLPQLPAEAVAGLWRQLARTSLRLSFAAGHLMRQPTAAAAAAAAADRLAGSAAAAPAAAAERQPPKSVVSSCAESVALAAKLKELRAELAADATTLAGEAPAASSAAPAAAGGMAEPAATAAAAAAAVPDSAAAVEGSAGAVRRQAQQVQQAAPSCEAGAADAARMPLTRYNIPGLAVCLAAHSLFLAARTFWAVARTALPASGRSVADAAFWLAASAAAALPFLG